MRTLLYNMHFRGRMSSAVADARSLRTTGSATSCVVTTTVLPSGVEADVKAAEGDLAFLESELRVTGTDSFEEDGMIVFGDGSDNVLRFSTAGHGRLSHCLDPGTMAGTASCSVHGGTGQFAAASGFINSTFTLTDSGELNDFHSGLIFLPEFENQQ